MAVVTRERTGELHAADRSVADGPAAIALSALVVGTLAYELVHGSDAVPDGSSFVLADVAAVALLCAGAVALVAWRHAAFPVLLASGLALLVSETLGSPSPLLVFAPPIALYAVAATSPAALSGGAAAVLALASVIPALLRPGPFDDDALDYLFALGAGWVLGYAVRLHQARAALLEDRAQQLARERDAATEAAVARERALIARELHDIVAHQVVLVVAQAGAANRVFDTEPERARQALSSIATLGREALTEMRRLLGVLAADGRVPTPRDPQPRLDALPRLAAQMDAAGLPVRLALRGDVRPLPLGIELNAYRIVQEALTNTLRHADATQATVELDYAGAELQVSVRDDGRGCPGRPVPGNGVVGMRQRAVLLGGRLDVGSRAGGGFAVTARLPLPTGAGP